MEAGRGRMVTLALRRDHCAIAKEDAAAFKEHIVSSAVPGQGSGKLTTSYRSVITIGSASHDEEM